MEQWDGKIERRKSMEENNKEMRVSFAVLQTDIAYIKTEITAIRNLVENKYVTMAEFQPIKNIVYGMVGLILISVVGGLLALVLRK